MVIKKIKKQKVILFLLIIQLISCYFFPISPQNQKGSILMQDIPSRSAYGLDPYTEDDFNVITVSDSEIEKGQPYSFVDDGYQECNVSITFPISAELWKIELPDTYTDAYAYKIQVSPSEVYYTYHDRNVDIYATSVSWYSDEDSYWVNMSVSAFQEVTLEFKLRVPMFSLEIDYNANSINRKAYLLSISRNNELNPNRPYFDVIFKHDFTVIFDNFNYTLVNLTGGIHNEITTSANAGFILQRTVDQASVYEFQFRLGYIKNRTDYLFELYIEEEAPPPSFFDDWIKIIAFYVVGGGVVGFGLMFLYYDRVKHRPLIGDFVWKQGIIWALGGIALFTSFGYLRFRYNF